MPKHRSLSVVTVGKKRKTKPEDALTEADRLRMENKILQAKIEDQEMEIKLLKNERIGRGRLVSGVRNEDKYLAIQYMNQAEHYPIQKLCAAVHVARSAYYKWLHRAPSHSQQVNELLVEWIRQHYEERNGILDHKILYTRLSLFGNVHSVVMKCTKMRGGFCRFLNYPPYGTKMNMFFCLLLQYNFS